MEKNIMRRKKDFTKLPESELQIMQLIWDMDKKGVKDIHAGALLAAYPDQIGHLALTTVLTLISRLQLKGFIDLEKHGRANCAIVLADENEYKRRAAKDFVDERIKDWSYKDGYSARERGGYEMTPLLTERIGWRDVV